MSLISAGVIVDCKKCKFLSASGNDSFDVTVSINDKETNIAGTAKLHCTISGKHHRVELTEWKPTDHHAMQSSDNFLNRVSMALDLIADQRLCGNRNLCPFEVIRIAEEVVRCMDDNTSFQ